MIKTAFATMAALGLLAPTAHAQLRRGRREPTRVIVVTPYPFATYYPYVWQPSLTYPGPILDPFYGLPTPYVVPTIPTTRIPGPLPE